MLKAGVGLFLGFIFIFTSVAQGKFKTPWLSGPVIDEVGILNPQDKAEIESLLHSANNRGIAQVQVFITSSLQGLPIEQASIEIVDQWKLGSKEKDNGLLFLIAPNERKIRIEVGQGLEGVMPDIYAKRINEDVVVPYFRQNMMSLGIVQGVRSILQVLDGGELQAIEQRDSRQSQKTSLPFWAIVLIWILIIFLSRIGGGGRGRRFRGGSWIGSGGFGGGGFGGGGGWSGGGGGFSGGGSSSSW